MSPSPPTSSADHAVPHLLHRVHVRPARPATERLTDCRFRNLFPGFGIAVVAFTAYVAYDNFTHQTNHDALKRAAKEDLEGQGVVSLLTEGKH